MITLTFISIRDESRVVIRGACFRICADGTLRGPDNGIISKYLDGQWQLVRGRHRGFDCGGPLFVRVANSDGRRERLGPYPLLKVANGGVFADDGCVAIHDSRQALEASATVCEEIAFLSSV